MRHRGGSEQPVKGRHANRPKARKVSIAALSVADLQKQVGILTRERDDALEQQRAAAEVLKIISASPAEFRPVLEVIVESAARFCDADDVSIFELDGQDLRIAAHRGPVPQEIGSHFLCTRGSVSGRAVIDRKAVHVFDLQAEADEFPEGISFARQFGHRTTASVPLLREGVAIGAILLRRAEVNPFTDKQIALLGTFAAQAVIAIENARLLTEQQEALERQTATAEVLQVINSSPGNLAPVFDAILEKAHSLCAVAHGSLQLYDGQKMRAVAVHGLSEAFADRLRQGFVPGPNHPSRRLLEGARFVQVHDQGAIDDPMSRAAFELAGLRTTLFIPLRKDGILLGRITASRREVKPFTEKEIGLLESFAAQAVIAIENARLLGELRDRTEDLGESLQQQTATADVLKVISRSAFDLQKVFDALTESACRVCGAYDAGLFLREAEFLRVRSHHGPIPMNFDRTRISRDWVNGRSVVDRKSVHVHDLQAEAGEFPVGCQRARRMGHRTILAVPLMREQEVVGSLDPRRTEVLPFSEKQISLAETFADQAVIAIENARLFD